MTDQVINNADQAPTLQIPESVQDLVGPGKKYATPEVALEALVSTQKHIETIEAENQTLRDEVSVRSSVEDQLKNHVSSQSTASDDQSLQANDDVDLATLIEQKLNERDALSVAKANVNDVNQFLVEKFGEEAKAKFEAKAAELSLNLSELAAKSPAAVKEFFKGDKAASNHGESSSINSDALDVFTTKVDKPKRAIVTTQDLIGEWKDCAPN